MWPNPQERMKSLMEHFIFVHLNSSKCHSFVSLFEPLTPGVKRQTYFEKPAFEDLFKCVWSFSEHQTLRGNT